LEWFWACVLACVLYGLFSINKIVKADSAMCKPLEEKGKTFAKWAAKAYLETEKEMPGASVPNIVLATFFDPAETEKLDRTTKSLLLQLCMGINGPCYLASFAQFTAGPMKAWAARGCFYIDCELEERGFRKFAMSEKKAMWNAFELLTTDIRFLSKLPVLMNIEEAHWEAIADQIDDYANSLKGGKWARDVAVLQAKADALRSCVELERSR
jgi:hypothetical protein